MDARATELIKQGDNLFSKRSSLLSLWQEVADNFYPERADFTVQRNLGQGFAENLMTSFPLIARRDLGNSFASMLRRDKWFDLGTQQEDREDNSAKQWLQWATGVQYRAMYDRKTQFVRATKEGDHDFATFGQTVIFVDLNRNRDTLLYRCYHLRDVAWCENADGEIDTVHRNWKPTARDLCKLFPKTSAQSVKDCEAKEPYKEIKCRHIIMPSDCCESPAGKKWRQPYVSIFIDIENQVILEEVGSLTRKYVIPRWQTVSGSQYAYSPATVAALPDARLIQAMTLTLLEAGEKAVAPPMVAVENAIRGDVALYAGGITWVDSAYDERLGEVLRPLTQDMRGLPQGMNMRDELKDVITQAFYLNQLNLPQIAGATAYEVSQRVQEYIRQALPIFSPMEMDYNGALCDETFTLLMANGAFGSPDTIPQSIRGTETQFKFKSPLNDAIAMEKGQHFQSAAQMLAAAIQIDPTVAADYDVHTAFRDAADGVGIPAKWLRSEGDSAAIIQQQQQAQQAQQAAQTINGGAQVAEQVGKAGKALSDAGMMA